MRCDFADNIVRRSIVTIHTQIGLFYCVAIVLDETFVATQMSWLEWVASNAYEGGVIDSMTSTRATFVKLSVFGISLISLR